MENTAQFDLNTALRLWLERLGQSPQVKAENLRELEAHLRDSVVQLKTKGLSSEESFLVATHRAGNPAQLEQEFAKVNRSPSNFIIHGLILIYFSVICWFAWLTLHLPQMVQALMIARAKLVSNATGYGMLPGFTQMMLALRDFMFVPPLLALVYCLYVWFQKSTVKNSWTGFFAVATATLVFILLPTLVAVLLPVISFMNQLPANIFQR
ncbi:MAG TPA: hypothetical protein VFY06_10175 [Verrucomicrobiae bacterium]|nr:hypothetical protein [Verrucomicrobiae bacterium]